MNQRTDDEFPEPIEDATEHDESVATRRRLLQGLGATAIGGVAWIVSRESGSAQLAAADDDEDDGRDGDDDDD
ncbi:MAG: hypothetical protein M3464_13035 [Chloroflexota bacterium]|nr:hypothetical protein [Chloroflexota bacterium]